MSWWTPTSKYKDFDAIICDGAVRSGKQYLKHYHLYYGV